MLKILNCFVLVLNSQILTTWGWISQQRKHTLLTQRLYCPLINYDNDTEYNCLKLNLIWTVYCYCNKWERNVKYEFNWQYHLLLYITALSEQCLHIVAVVSAICIQCSLVRTFRHKYKPGETFVFHFRAFQKGRVPAMAYLAFKLSCVNS